MGRRVLLVEDDEVTRYLVKRMLLRAGVEVSEAASAEDGVRLLDSLPFDAVLSDFRLPGQDGSAVLAHAKRVQPRARRALMSGTLGEDVLRLKADGGCADFVFEKPFGGQAWSRLLHLALAETGLTRLG